ncbi:MAG: four helix bundle protein [Candidatus Sungbacteria bacterium RIFCSPLOWO2_02_FULL_51_17]|uniref:Four helix bundle protein n=1 Tax=Candidatus Sungbacteria bacterium RIFCSPHIGHO2_02_FULL_51_29 TaxID=1802273 RepID=A0A1G2KSB1_9BACT|nr:MAG: four helix bundle protein [Candidatus Sungbacteria bacterium RIFCSPHIGHO2_01_FULL_51_22]OHA01299.1 MAG: four helix bundle protein [Candidatus Sungbacteria bacterium RIFCSPHIGHO2_02_FULL_51_29]OHA12534.1 MAG: four helix bundle protein [Candidatus Sungbacteria bacterium RIFCSPLOWO2_02_FULL_51_17]
MEGFTNLKVWQKTHEYVLDIYRITKMFSPDEKYALVQQVRRAAVSIAANIAEGSKRRSLKDKIHFYNIADTSLEETKYYPILSRDLAYIFSEEQGVLMEKANEIGRVLNGLMRALSK